jgi:hypothetical protein
MRAILYLESLGARSSSAWYCQRQCHASRHHRIAIRLGGGWPAGGGDAAAACSGRGGGGARRSGDARPAGRRCGLRCALRLGGFHIGAVRAVSRLGMAARIDA